MAKLFSLRRAFRLVRRESADRYLLLLLVGFAGSVSLTRFFLSLTGYPQIGGGELHIAHALWGGLLLFVAVLMPLLWANQGAFTASALVAGIGVGLFIDEVGKFITTTNNYFYPAAAPILYIFFILTTLLFIRYLRPAHSDDHAELSRAMEAIQESLRRPFSPHKRADLEKKLNDIASFKENGPYARLAEHLLLFVQDNEPLAVPVKTNRILKARLAMEGWLNPRFLYPAILILLMVLGMISLKNPAGALLSQYLPGSNVIESILTSTAGRHLESTVSPELARVRMILETVDGTLFLLSGVIMLARRHRIGIFLALTALVISFTSTNILVFYFEQFSTMVMIAIQFVLLFCLLAYQRQTAV